MRHLIARRRGGEAPDAGVYAILYAVLVVVLVGMGAIVVDIAQVRADRRADRSATDAAALGGAELLDPQASLGLQPQAACLRAWQYLAISLHLAASDIPAARCSNFSSVSTSSAALTYCSTASPTEIDDDQVIGKRTYRVAWPIPKTGGQGFLTPEIAPGSASQTYNGTVDGSDKGCDRLGVAVFENETFALGQVLGANGTKTQEHSVALYSPTKGPLDNIAALNVLTPTDCSALITTGGGQVVVGPVLRDGVLVGPGSIAVESKGSTGCGGSKYVIDPTTGSGSLVCASSVILSSTSSCDGKGIIADHALDPGGANAYSVAATSGGNLAPVPTAEGGVHSWNPVTAVYGCNTAALSPCQVPATNYVALLEAAYGGSGLPSSVYTGVAPYVNPYPGAFATVPASACGNITTVVVLAPGNWYFNCAPTVKNGGTLIVQGGNIVTDGDLTVSSGGCFAMNTLVTTCPTGVSGSGSTVTSPTLPVADSIVFLRNGTINTSGSLVMPQTFVYSRTSANHPLAVNSTALTLWTAPGAGAKDGAGRTTLEEACFDTAKAAVNTDCMASRFGKVVYWSDYPAPKSGGAGPCNFAGQGSLNIVGVFFTPRSYFNFTGGGTYTAAAAQFWADKLNVNGGAAVGLIVDAKFGVPTPSASITLIR